MTEVQKTTASKATETVRRVRQLVKGLYSQAQEAKAQGRPIAYCMVVCQYDEILRAMDIVPIWTENYAGLCAAKREAERFLLKAEADGYSNLICGYARTGLGFDAMRREQGDIPPNSPDGGMVEPDMLLGSSSGCDSRYKWYQALGHYLDTPVYNFDVLYPPVDANVAEVREYFVRYLVEQLR
jgi:benzoyl-CoA reductase/2-hydroxyglutaryl-CoA dehydratase subunit BcrC/BadD/HgdB